MNILFLEDDIDLAKTIIKALIHHEFAVTHVDNGEDGLQEGLTNEYAVIIADRMLPGMDGLDVIKQLRQMGNQTPVLILSGLGEVDDRVEGLQAGGDDYLVKPCSLAELVVRLEVLGRRQGGDSNPGDTLQVEDLIIDRIKRKVTRSGIKILLQPREFRLLEYFIQNRNQIITRQMLLQNVWDIQFDPQTNLVDVHISRLRGKIDKGFGKPLLETVRGKGYRLTCDNN